MRNWYYIPHGYYHNPYVHHYDLSKPEVKEKNVYHHIYDHTNNNKLILTTRRKSEDLSMPLNRPQLHRNSRSAPVHHIYTK